MSLKLSPGCQCCPDDEGTCPIECSAASEQTEFEVTFSGLTDATDCSENPDSPCEAWNGTFTLNGIVHVVPSVHTAPDWSNGWSGNVHSSLWDVPYSATSACVWKYSFEEYCRWTYTVGDSPPQDDIVQGLWAYGIVLARFKRPPNPPFWGGYIWRLIITYEASLHCEAPLGSDSDVKDSGWWWELEEWTNNCSLSGSETWVSSGVPPWGTDLSVSCVHNTDSDFADYCAGTLSLTSVADG